MRKGEEPGRDFRWLNLSALVDDDAFTEMDKGGE